MFHSPPWVPVPARVPKRLELWAPGVQLGALMHLAGVLADGVLPSLTLESLEKSYAPKATGDG